MAMVSNSLRLPAVLLKEPVAMPSDDLATEILPAPPPLSSLPPANFKKDSHQKKVLNFPQYLPSCDPGSTYTGGTGVMSGLEAESRRRKRPRLDKRAQRASARTMTADQQSSDSHLANGSGLNLIIPSTQELLDDDNVAEEYISKDGEKEEFPSIEAEVPDSTPYSSSSRPSRQKGKAKESLVRQVKIEGSNVSSVKKVQRPVTSMANHDHCSACRSVGSLLYCDSCPRAYHLWCLNPPLDHSEIPGPGYPWDCPACALMKAENARPPFPSKWLMSNLLVTVQSALPCEYSLPEDIRAYFKNVGTGPRGTYSDGVSMRPRLNRLGFPEDRDPYRLRDRSGSPVLCFRCGKSSLPEEHSTLISSRPQRAATKAKSTEIDVNRWKRLISCDFCSLSWHLDCLSPPLTTMPPLMKKWMCPNHAEQTISNRRQPKVGLHRKEIRSTGLRNNGQIEIIPSNDSHTRNTVPVDEVLINSRVYRVPERVIILDFWGRINGQPTKRPHSPEAASLITPSSPLTSLSSLDEDRDESQEGEALESDTIDVAQVLCSLPGLQHDSWIRENRKLEDGSFSSIIVKDETVTPVLSRGIIPGSPLSILSDLSPDSESDEDLRGIPRPDANAKLKIRIPRPLNMAVATASRASKPPPRRSLRRTLSRHKSEVAKECS